MRRVSGENLFSADISAAAAVVDAHYTNDKIILRRPQINAIVCCDSFRTYMHTLVCALIKHDRTELEFLFQPHPKMERSNITIK